MDRDRVRFVLDVPQATDDAGSGASQPTMNEDDPLDTTERSITRLTVAGWLLVALSCAVIVGIAAVVGPWALQTIDRSILGMSAMIVLLAVPSLLGGAAAFLLGSRGLRRLGVSVWRPSREPGD